MSIESAIEQRIREAMARGEFDNLPGNGKQIDLDSYFLTPKDVRMGYSILKANNFVPEEVELLKEIAELKQKLNDCLDEDQRLRFSKLLRDRSLTLALILEKSKRKR